MCVCVCVCACFNTLVKSKHGHITVVVMSSTNAFRIATTEIVLKVNHLIPISDLFTYLFFDISSPAIAVPSSQAGG